MHHSMIPKATGTRNAWNEYQVVDSSEKENQHGIFVALLSGDKTLASFGKSCLWMTRNTEKPKA